MSITRRAAVLGILVVLLASEAARGQGLDANALARIKSLTCVFPVYASGTWKNGKPAFQAQAGPLSIRIEEIDVQNGSARFVGTGESAHVIAQLFDWTLHFLETGNSGSVKVTTVFAQETRAKKLKAVQSRHEYLHTSVPGFVSEPTVSQYYGECEAGQ